MKPIRDGSGTGLSVPGYTEVREGDGTVLWSGGPNIPDSDMFQSPIYQWWGAEIAASDGASPVDWPESLADLSDAAAVNDPTKQTQSGFESVLYDGATDGHSWDSDSKLPTGGSAHSLAALIYPLDTTGFNTIVSWGQGSEGDGMYFTVDDGTLNYGVWASNQINSGTISSDSWQTVGARAKDGDQEIFINGSAVGSVNNSLNLLDANHSIGYREINNQQYFDGYIAEVIVSAEFESAQAFSDYHNDRLG